MSDDYKYDEPDGTVVVHAGVIRGGVLHVRTLNGEVKQYRLLELPSPITRADVDAMDEAVESMRRRLMHEGYGFANGEALLGVVRLLSQKLAALLPPERA